MSLTSELNKARRKRLEEEAENGQPTSPGQQMLYSRLNISAGKAASQKDEDIAPVKDTTESDERTWFQNGAFEDGYQFGDLTKTIFAGGTDMSRDVKAGFLGIGENVVDAGAYLVGGAQSLLGFDEAAKKTQEFIEKDLYDEQEVAKAFEVIDPSAWITALLTGGKTEENSFLGDKTDALAQSGGQLVGTIALQSVGVPWWVTSGVTSFGGETENAFNQGADYAEAGGSALISAGAEILTEKLSGGIKFGGQTLSDVAIQPLVDSISNKVVRTMVNLGLDAAGEGAEEVISQVISNLGSSLYREESLEEILTSEEALDEYIESFIGGAALGGGMGGANALNSIATGRDYKTGLTDNEQKVVDKEIANRVSEAESDGKTLTSDEKAKIKEDVLSDLKKGYISTDTIESALGGESYKAYQDAIANDEGAIKELEGLFEGAELEQAIGGITKNSKQGELKAQTSKEVADLIAKGKDGYLSESYNEVQRRTQAFEADISKYDAKQQETIKKAAESGILNNTRKTHEFVDMIAKISADKGVSFDFTNNAKLAETGFAIEGKTVNGFVKDGVITTNIDSAKALNTVVGHEITHVLEGTEIYGELQKAITEYATTKGEYNDRLKAAIELYKDIDGYKGADGMNAIKREVVSDLVGEYLFTDADFVNNLSTKNKNLFQKIFDEIKYLYKMATAGSKEARELEKVKRTFEQAYKSDKAKAEKKAQTEAAATVETETTAEATAEEIAEEITEAAPTETAESPVVEEATEAPMPETDVKDNSGNQLTEAQEERFKDSKVRDKDGVLKVTYRSSSKSSDLAFSKLDSRYAIFRNGTVFTDSKTAAESQAATDLHGKPRIEEKYLNLTNPMDMDAQADAQAWQNAFPEVTFPESGANRKFYDALEKHFGSNKLSKGDMPNRIKAALEGMGFDGITHRGFNGDRIYIALDPNSAWNTTDAAAETETRFSLSKPVEETKDLMALHNLKANELLKSLDLGGLPMPSIAVIKADAGHEQYGDVSLILPKETIDPKANKANKVYGGDAWTPTYPKIEYKPNAKVEKKIADKYYELANNHGYDAAKPLYRYTYELEDVLNREGGEAALLESLYDSTDLMQAYLLDTGKGKVDTVQKEIRTELSDVEVDQHEFFINELGADVINSVMAANGENPAAHKRQYWEQHGESIKETYKKLLTEKYDFTEENVQNVFSNMKTYDFLKLVRDAYLYRKNGRVTVKTEPDFAATTEAIKKAAGEGYKSWVDGLFKGIEEKSGIRNNAEYFTPSGNRRSWNALHWENTLENVVRAMKQQKQTGADAIFAAHQIFATSAKEYKSIDAVKADSHRLRTISPEAYEEIKDSYTSRFTEIAGRIADKGERNQFIALDNAMECIVDAVRSSRTKAGITKNLSQYPQLTVTEKDVADIVSLVADISNMPTGYFEAKPQRAVGFDEVGVFVIPSNADAKLKQELLNKGYSIAEYNPDIEGDRKRVVNSFEKYKFSLSGANETQTQRGNYNVYGKDVRLEAPEAESIAPTPEAVSKTETAPETVAPMPESETASPADLAAIAKEARREYFHGAYTQDGKQYLSDGSFIAEFNTVDESLEQRNDFPVKKATTVLNEAFERQVQGNFDVHEADGGYIKVGDSVFDSKYVNAVIRAFDNPKFTISKVQGGNDALLITGDNGRAVLMPVRAGDNVNIVYEAKAVTEDIAPKVYDEGAPIAEDIATALGEYNAQSLTDADAPPEMDAPFYGDEEATAADPFENRDIKEVGNRKVKAYMYENPEVKPFFQAEANVMLGELQRSTKGERFYNDELYYETNGEKGFSGTKRETSGDIEYLLDELHYTYAEIEKGLKAIIEDNGAENNACSKRIEFLLNDRLLQGSTDFITGEEIPPNQEYINLINEKQIREYSEEARTKFFEAADDFAPMTETAAETAVSEGNAPAEDIAPIAEQYEAIRPKKEKQPRLMKAPEETTGTQTAMFEKTAEVLETEPEAKKKGRGWQKFRTNFLDKFSVFEDLALKTNNRELMGKANQMLNAESAAQWLIGKGTGGVKSLNDIRAEVESTGLTKQFSEYLYHKHNIDRMSLEERYGTPNKAVFGDSVTADVSSEAVSKFEAEHPEFVDYAKDVYDYMGYLRGQLVDNGVISQETAELWADMYPHYVPIRRAGDKGLNINVPLDTGRTGVNAPIKRATGGNSDILPLFDTMAMRTEQTYRAVAKNRFGVELKNTLNPELRSAETSLDEVIDSIDNHEGLLKKGENGKNPTFTVFEHGKRMEFDITEDMYDALKPTSEGLRYTNPIANGATNLFRGVITEYNPVFMATNAIKDAQDILMNSQHAAKTYANLPNAIVELARKGKWYTEYMQNGGEQNTYFDGQTNTFKKEDNVFKKIVGMPFRAIQKANNFIERAPRLAEYMASRKSGASVEVAMLDAARVTTNFAAGGDVTKFINRNGATFLNASVQGFNQQVRNIREAKANGLKGWTQLAAKTALAGLPALLLNNLLWDDDEEYAELSDYVKENYYVVAKYGDGQFIRIPKGRTVAVIQNAFEQIANAATGDDKIDLERFLELAISNLAPNNPIDNNILSPIIQVANNKTWYGEDLVPTRLQDLPDAEQYDESTDAFSKWLGEKTGVLSPYKINYLLNQYGGGIADVLLPMGTPEAERGDNSLLGNILAPMKDKFTTDGVMNNQNVTDFYSTVDELTKNANSAYATDEDILKYKYMNSVNASLSELYQQKRDIQNSDLPNAEKYEQAREIQKQIDEMTKEGLNTYENVNIQDGYATVGDIHFRWYEPSADSDAEPGWQKISGKQLEKQEKVTSGLGISASEYWSNKEEYDYAYDYPAKYAVSKAVGGYEAYKTYSSELYDIKADKDENGKSISGSRKEKVIDYINNMDADYGEKIILFKSEYNADDTYNQDIIDYLNSREDISYSEMETILKELGFTVHSDGRITW